MRCWETWRNWKSGSIAGLKSVNSSVRAFCWEDQVRRLQRKRVIDQGAAWGGSRTHISISRACNFYRETFVPLNWLVVTVGISASNDPHTWLAASTFPTGAIRMQTRVQGCRQKTRGMPRVLSMNLPCCLPAGQMQLNGVCDYECSEKQITLKKNLQERPHVV